MAAYAKQVWAEIAKLGTNINESTVQLTVAIALTVQAMAMERRNELMEHQIWDKHNFRHEDCSICTRRG